MKKRLLAFFYFIDLINRKLGDGLSILIMVLMFFTSIEVVLRYFFNSPTIWVWPLSRQIFGVYILVAGIYSTLKGTHIKIEIFYSCFSDKIRRVADMVAFIAFFVSLSALIFKGTQMGMMSLSAGETSHGAFRIPLYPLKIFIPIAALLFLFEGVYMISKKENSN